MGGPRAIKKLLFTASSISLGCYALIGTQKAISGGAETLVPACLKSPENQTHFVQVEGFQPYEPLLGGPIVCVLTQFIYDLAIQVRQPSGFLVWSGLVMTYLPMMLLLIFEAGRSSSRALVRYPTIVCILGQLLGISVVLPLVWLPSYFLLHGSAYAPLSYARARMSLLAIFPPIVLTALVFGPFFVEESEGVGGTITKIPTYTWTVIAGLLAGPVGMACTPLLYFNLHPPSKPVSEKQKNLTIYAVVFAYSVAGALAFLCWALWVFRAFSAYGLDYQLMIDDLWNTPASGSVKFMSIDDLVLYASLVLYIAYHRFTAAIECLLQTLLFGPGASVAMILAQLEMEQGAMSVAESGKKNS